MRRRDENELNDVFSLPYRLIWIVGTIALILIFCLTSWSSYQVYVVVQMPSCVGQSRIVGHRAGIEDFLAFPVFVFACLGFFLWLPLKTRKEIPGSLIAAFDAVTVLEFLSLRVGWGIFSFILATTSIVVIAGSAAVVSVNRYLSLLTFCRTAIGS